jgi:hypothetical protein
MDEAYLRRIAYKISIPDPSREQLGEITRRFCTIKGVRYTDDAITYLLDRLYAPGLRTPHGCFARDIVTTVLDEAEFNAREPLLDRESIDTACELYLGNQVDQAA